MNAQTGIQVIHRAAEILRQLKRDNSGQSLGSIAAQTGLPRSTVQRIVNALVAEEWIAKSGRDGDLRLGPEIQALAAAGRIDVPGLLRPGLMALCDRTGETVDLAVYRMARLTFLDQISGRHRLSAVSIPGQDFPLTQTANGKAVLALLPEERVSEIWRREASGASYDALRQDIAQVQEMGMAFDLDEHTSGISAAGIAFKSVTGEIFAVSVPAPSARFQRSRRLIELELKTFLNATVLSHAYFIRPQKTQGAT